MLRNSIRLLLLLVIMGCSMVSCKTLRRNHAAPDATALYEPYRSNDAQPTPGNVAQEKSDETGENAGASVVLDEVSVAATDDVVKSDRPQDVYGVIPAAPVAKASTSTSSPAAGKRGTASRTGSNPGTSVSAPTVTLTADSSVAVLPVPEDSVVATDDSIPAVAAPQRPSIKVSEAGIFEDADKEDGESSSSIMKILVIALVVILLLFIAYIIYTRRRLQQMKEEQEEALLDLRYKHYKNGHRDDADVQREIQEKVNAAVAELESERESAVQAKEKAERELQEAYAAREAAASQASAEVMAELAEKEKALAELNASLDAKENEIAERQHALAEKESQMAAQFASLKEKDENLDARRAELENQAAAMAERENELASRNAELAEQSAELEARSAELQARDAELQAAREELQNQVAAAAVIPVTETNTESRSAEINSMRKMLIRKIESVQTVLDLKGEKKGEVLTKDEWKDIENFLESADGGFVSRLKEKCPSLTAKDIELMLLLRLRIPSKNIASVYGINEKSIKQKLFVYKTKVGLESDTMSLRDYIENL